MTSIIRFATRHSRRVPAALASGGGSKYRHNLGWNTHSATPTARFLSTATAHNNTTHHEQSPYMTRRNEFQNDIDALPEHKASTRLFKFLESNILHQHSDLSIAAPVPPTGGYQHEMSAKEYQTALDAALATFCLHVEARIASLIGQGFYTIGPCGEEALSSAGCAVNPEDSLALHYRHLGMNIARQLSRGESMEQILLERARGYTVSRHDSVTGGVHCSIGSDPSLYPGPGAGDFLVTSTLASQCPSAVGRALGYSLLPRETLSRKRPVAFVTVGDGSVHNHHFWSAFHLSRHARHRKVKCPTVFGISDNGLSISYKTEGYVDTAFDNDPLIPVYRVQGNDMMHVYSQTKAAMTYARTQSAPAVILYQNLIRRFGHAASDRQAAYLESSQILDMADNTVLESTIQQAVETLSFMTYRDIYDRFLEIKDATLASFAQASQEDKVTRNDMLDRVSVTAAAVPKTIVPRVEKKKNNKKTTAKMTTTTKTGGSSNKLEVMRKHMTRVLEEVMTQDDSVVYLGEDVIHGGYYVVTEGLASKFPGRVLDFPPDETSLLGAAMGFSQVGLTPIVEIPYAKYLDCGADMFYEIAIANWLSNGKRPNGMVVRLQGFDRGVFGGNFHTTNILPHMPPGVDVVCYSNGEDYVRGFRNAILQAKAGRVVMTVDCTQLLNLRHLFEKDRGWERAYPELQDDKSFLTFDEIRRHGTNGHACIVTYGNGVVTAIQARRLLLERGLLTSESELDIIDCPYLSAVPNGLREVIGGYKGILFADICKDGPGGSVLSSFVTTLHQEGSLPSAWQVVAAPRTYNPLGSMCTFLNVDDILAGCESLFAKLPK